MHFLDLGYSYVITLAKLKSGTDGSGAVLPDAAINSFMEIMPDGSAKIRICLFADIETGKAEISTMFSFIHVFREIYSDTHNWKPALIQCVFVLVSNCFYSK